MSFISKEDLKEVGRGMAAMAVAIALIIGASLTESWVLMTLGGGAGGALLAKVATKGRLKNLIGWGTIGAVAGLIFWTTL